GLRSSFPVLLRFLVASGVIAVGGPNGLGRAAVPEEMERYGRGAGNTSCWALCMGLGEPSNVILQSTLNRCETSESTATRCSG
ncbi:hypothetical protein BD779DRAFT_1493068, partial [Infundibulicybe gibba]